MKKQILTGLIAAFALTAATDLAAGGKRDDHDLAWEALQKGEVLPLTKILALTASHVPGEVVKLELESKKKRLYYEIKVLTPAGRIRELYLDARTGEFLGMEND